ncbi:MULTISPECIES: hypothetical protein [unclassified Moorena]|nr:MULTISPECIES: hypothetical protein [unclassified Moorena]
MWEVWEVWGDGEMGRWGNGEMGRWGDEKVWGNGEIGVLTRVGFLQRGE